MAWINVSQWNDSIFKQKHVYILAVSLFAVTIIELWRDIIGISIIWCVACMFQA
jgi:hypothetical protein